MSKSLKEICSEKRSQENCLLVLVENLKSYEDRIAKRESEIEHPSSQLMSRYQLMVSSVLLTTLPWDFPGHIKKKKIICSLVKFSIEYFP